MPMWFRIVRLWLPIAAMGTVLVLMSYASVQQTYRTGLNDPQVQMAQDAAAQLDAGVAPAKIVSATKVDAEKSLAPFMIIYDTTNTPVASSAVLSGSTPKAPSGVLDTARSKGSNKVTWQPSSGVRIAAVAVGSKDGHVVLVGRNMREVESRIGSLGQMSILGWLAAMIGSLIVVAAVELYGGRRFAHHHHRNHGV
ncbi:MAG: hypothetical protein HGA39_02080 [Coriobacteriia bacterium]|nr:hypothetical protein [Coriobacteriia bacterium]